MAAALAGITAPLQPRRPVTVVSCDELPGWLEVSEAENDDGLDQALADQRGISRVLAEDRDLLYVRTRLALPDVAAAVIRVVAEVHHAPRLPQPRGEVPGTVAERLAVTMTPLLRQAGFTPTPSSPRHFWQAGGDGFAQSLMLSAGAGYASDGTSYAGLVCVDGGTYVPELAHWKIATPEQRCPATAA